MTVSPKTRTIRYDGDLVLSCYPLLRGSGDPTMKIHGRSVARATRTPEGPAEIHIHSRGGRAEAEAWGEGADWALDNLADLIGARDDPGALNTDVPEVRRLQRLFPGLRMTRTDRVMEAVVPAILEQKVTGREAWRAFRAMVRAWGEPAPGTTSIRVQPSPERIAVEPYHAFHPFGIERRRAETLRLVCGRARSLEARHDPEQLGRMMLTLRGIGRWTVAEVVSRALGDPDAVSVGDYHTPGVVAWFLAGERRAGDERMLELLEPFAGQRGRVIRLIEASGIRPPSYGPRMAPRNIAAL